MFCALTFWYLLCFLFCDVVACCSSFVVVCGLVLFAVCCTVCDWLFGVWCVLFVVCVLVGCCSLFVVCCSLRVVDCSWFLLCRCLVNVVYCSVCVVFYVR